MKTDTNTTMSGQEMVDLDLSKLHCYHCLFANGTVHVIATSKGVQVGNRSVWQGARQASFGWGGNLSS